MNYSTRKALYRVILVFKHPVKSYKKVLKTYPVLVQSLQTGILYGCSDVLAQHFVERVPLSDIDTRRSLIFSTVGIIYTGPIVTLWYRFLSRKIGTTGNIVTIKKVIIDQFGFVPFFHLGLLTTLNTLHGQNIEDLRDQLRLKYFDILFASVRLWPMVQLINFRFTPLNYQVLVSQSVALFWNVYVSWKTQQGVTENKSGSHKDIVKCPLISKAV
ncbi:protein Mpv17 [Diabrotica virgifera virgifera]|uniref:Mitochondrial inner membrane protein Mpv17 n=1 Tax=Diabrotica virgifera virgifera TaxID=50390 RepID=A0A6P7FET9_DIAVI|nr:protein Mpv17 [Diabrotica virgifera virgifera]